MGRSLSTRRFSAAGILVVLCALIRASVSCFFSASGVSRGASGWSTSSTPVSLGDRLKGTITDLGMKGAVLDLCRDKPGFLHISQIKEGRVDRIEDELSLGQKVEVTVRKLSHKKIEVTMLNLKGKRVSDFSVGDKVKGNVVAVTKRFAFLDIGATHEAVLTVEENADLSKGQELDVTVQGINGKGIQVTVDHSASLTPVVPGDRLKGTVKEFNKWGAILDLNQDKPGFLHLSQIRTGRVYKIEDELFLGQEVEVTVRPQVKEGQIEVTMLKSGRGEALVFDVGDRVKGKVVEVTKKCVFLDVGAEYPAMLKVEETSDYSKGQEFGVTVQKIAAKGVKVLEVTVDRSASSSPVVPGQRLNGTIKEFNRWGAILDLNRDMPGFLHVSRVAPGRVNRIDNWLSLGQEVEVTVRGQVRGQIEVTMLKSDRKEASVFNVGDRVKGKVVKVTDKRVFLDVGAVYPAMLEVEKASEYSKDQEFRVTVQTLDSMGMKVVEAE